MMSSNNHHFDLGPLRDGDTVAVIGGGPGGTACAMTLLNESRRAGKDIEVVLFEGKRFGRHFNQCAGVLSPPICSILRDLLDLELPGELVQRRIRGYVLHSHADAIELSPQEVGIVEEDQSLAVRRVEFDQFMLEQAQERGVKIVNTRATDIELHAGEVVVYSWSGTCRAKVVVGAFGLSRAMTYSLSTRTAYQPPPHLETVVTKVHPSGLDVIPDLLGDMIHVILPRLRGIEFVAMIPKGNHVTIIVAGRRLTTDAADAVLQLSEVRSLLPCDPKPEDYFKGSFPVGLAKAPFGNRYVTLGDSAGLVRPFKGKGINSAIITGHRVAETMLREGVSEGAFRSFWRDCGDIAGDLWYGRLIRRLTHVVSHRFCLQPVIEVARVDPFFRRSLYDCVSGRETYRNIVCRKENLRLAARLGMALLSEALFRRGAHKRAETPGD